MFDLRTQSYDDVKTFLEQNITYLDEPPCVEYNFSANDDEDLYELIIVHTTYEYYDDPNKNFNVCDVTFEKCYYYILKYNDESFYNELSVIDCGGYYIAMCIFKNKINITEDVIPNMYTLIGNKTENIPKRYSK